MNLRNWLIMGLVILVGLFGIAEGLSQNTNQEDSVEKALKMLRDGNHRFVSGNRTFPHLDKARLKELLSGQHPYATVITCSDSRVAPEHIFDTGLGDIFTIRVAGNVCDTDEVGSIEYGVDHLGTPILVVMGHTSCGAVTAVATKAELHGSIPALVDNIKPAIEKVQSEHPNLHGNDLVSAAIKANVWQSIDDLLKTSHATRERIKDGRLKVIGAIYHLEDGKVDWLGIHPQQTKLLKRSSDH